MLVLFCKLYNYKFYNVEVYFNQNVINGFFYYWENEKIYIQSCSLKGLSYANKFTSILCLYKILT